MKNKIRKLLKLGIEIIKNNKLITVIILISLLFIYFLGIRPYQIRKQCSTVTKFNSSYQYTNPAYNEVAEMQKQRMLADYIQCRNNNLAEGDQIYININGHNPNPFTQEQYNTLTISELSNILNDILYPDIFIKGHFGNYNPKQDADFFGLTIRNLEQLNKLVLGKLPSSAFYAYNGYIIGNGTYNELKNNKDKYPQCSFPADFVEKELWGGGGKYTTNATDAEYNTCLRKNGLEDNKKPTPQEVRKDKALCYQWYGRACDDPNFNPE